MKRFAIKDCACGSDRQTVRWSFIYNWVQCEACGRKSEKCEHLEDAIIAWNRMISGLLNKN